MFTQTELKEFLDYNPYTGKFTWKKNVGKKKLVGKEAGYVNVYVSIRFKKKLYQAHRLAWFWYYGEWPKEDLDHINSNKHDNRIVNLREATRGKNEANKPLN